MTGTRAPLVGGAGRSMPAHVGSRIHAEVAIRGVGDVTLGYNSYMAKADSARKVPLRGCGALSPLYDEALTWAASLHRDQLKKNTRVAYMSRT